VAGVLAHGHSPFDAPDTLYRRLLASSTSCTTIARAQTPSTEQTPIATSGDHSMGTPSPPPILVGSTRPTAIARSTAAPTQHARDQGEGRWRRLRRTDLSSSATTTAATASSAQGA